MEATALHDFHATAEDELSFKKGSVLKVRVRLCVCAGRRARLAGGWVGDGALIVVYILVCIPSLLCGVVLERWVHKYVLVCIACIHTCRYRCQIGCQAVCMC